MASRFFHRIKHDKVTVYIQKGKRKVIFCFGRFLTKDNLIKRIEGWYHHDRKLMVSKMVLVALIVDCAMAVYIDACV